MKLLGQTGLQCHPFGFGCYRIELGNHIHKTALQHYLEMGGNLIDTSANYTDGNAERLLGQILSSIKREDVIIVTKAGYIQGENMTLAKKHSFPEVIKYGPDLWHCIHPEFLKTQIDRSCERMKIETIDVFLLHNPEYFLNYYAQQDIVTENIRNEFYRRIREAFSFLETEVKNGRIKHYGISSNNYPLPCENKVHTSVYECLKQAREITPNHNFKVIQFPLNLFESGAALNKNNEGKTVLEFCQENGIATLANRPLNAFFQNQLIRLADINPLSNRVSPQNQSVSDVIKEQLYNSGYPKLNLTLSQMALSTLASLDGLSCVLVGMRRDNYVDEVMSISQLKEVDSLSILENFDKWLESH